MHSKIPPESISVLNIFERSLIQLGKCFQTIIKLKPFKYNTKSYSDFVPAMKGIEIHLPLPCEASHDHVRDTLPSADKLNILVDSFPTKEKKIWRSLVNMKKVFKALKYLKIINPNYSSFKIIDSFEL
jgi:hypothetical protein